MEYMTNGYCSGLLRNILPNRFLKHCCIFALVTFNTFATWANEYGYELLNQNDGFSSSIIFSIVQDDNGFLWFGSGFDGLMRYDGKSVKHFKRDPSNGDSLQHDNAGNLFINSQGDLWIGSWGGSVIKGNLNTQYFTQYKHVSDAANTVSSDRIQSVFEDDNNQLWFGSADNGLSKFNSDSQDFQRFPFQKDNKNGISHPRVWAIEQAEPRKLWLATGLGLNLLDMTTQSFTHFIPEPELPNSDLNKLRGIIKTANGNLYLGTDNGVLFFDTLHGKFESLDIAGRSSVGAIYEMLRTDFNEYWVSTPNGVFSFTDTDKTLRKVPLDFNDVCSQSLFQDRQGTIWLSCEGVGVYKITRNAIFKTFDNNEAKDAIVLRSAKDNSILIGTENRGLYSWMPETLKLTQLSADKAIYPAIFSLAENSKGDIYHAGTQRVFVIDSQGSEREVIPPETLIPYFQNIRNIAIDHQDNVWLIADESLFIINAQSATFTHLLLSNLLELNDASMSLNQTFDEPVGIPNIIIIFESNGTPLVIVNDVIYRLDEDKKKLLPFSYGVAENRAKDLAPKIYSLKVSKKHPYFWLGDTSGLYSVEPTSGERKLLSDYFNVENNRHIYFIHEDQRGDLWLVTAVGLSKFNVENNTLQHFDQRDGLPSSRLFYRPTVRKSDGSFYFSSRDGITYFNPNVVNNRDLDYRTLLTDFEVLGSPEMYNSLQIQNAGLRLQHNETNIKFEFATMDLRHARQIEYSYILEGFDERWINNGSSNTATYTNLYGGDYFFRVRSSYQGDEWYTEELGFNVYIATPLWRQDWMYFVYAIALMLLAYWYIQRQKKAVVKLERLVAEKTEDIAQESEKLAAANRIKTQFLANMSHEIRTPLTTVIGQAEAIICRDVKQQDIYQEVEVIHDSSLYLLSLLNDILDLTKIEENKFELDYSPQNLKSLLATINTMFSMQAKNKGLTFTLVENLPSPFIVNIDGIRLKQILINLLSNALKFTMKGYVRLQVELTDKHLVFKVEDSGIGISQAQMKQLFISFTQGDSSIRRRFGGSGLGLHLSNQLAILMRGSIEVESQVEEGSVFTFSMPLPEFAEGY
jgi:signal transduction histidine kinase/streptogramin lyase